MARQPASALKLGQIGERVTIYWQRNSGEGSITGTITAMATRVEDKLMLGSNVGRYITSTEVSIDDVRVPCDEWEAAE